MNEEKKKSKVLQFAIALFVVFPSMLFWLLVLVLVLGVLTLVGDKDEPCNIAHVSVQGVLAATDTGISKLLGLGVIVSADSIVEQLTAAEENTDVVGVLLDIDSPGGTPVAADEVFKALVALKKPTVSLIRDRGASAAYWVAAGTDHIVASPISEVGSIGVTMSYTEYASSSEGDGARWIDLSSGPFKDAGNPERVLSEEEESYFQSQVDEVYEYMLDEISFARTILTREELRSVADGRVYLGTKALELKLVDVLGGINEVKSYFAQKLSIDVSEVVVCPVPKAGIEDLLQ